MGDTDLEGMSREDNERFEKFREVPAHWRPQHNSPKV